MYGTFVALLGLFNTIVKFTSLALSEFYIGLAHGEHHEVSSFFHPTVHP